MHTEAVSSLPVHPTTVGKQPLAEETPYDVILVNPSSVLFDNRAIPNVGLTAIDAYLNHKGYRCRVVDLHELGSFVDKATVFGFSVWDHTYQVACRLLPKLQGKTIIWGGWAVNSRPEFILSENPDVDYAVIQDGEHRILALLESFKDPTRFPGIDGIAYREPGGGITVRQPTGYFDLNELPTPDASTAVPPHRADRSGIVYVELARGCYGRCAYCQHVIKMRFRDAAKVAQELEYFRARGYRRFYIGNDNTVAKVKLLEQLVDELEERKLDVEIMVTGRPNDVLKGRHVIERIFKSGTLDLFAIEMGIESNSARMLELLQRGLTPETNHKAMKFLVGLKKKYSPHTTINANIILFTHWDMGIEDFVDNVRFLGDYDCSRETMSLRLYGVAGTPIWDAMHAQGFEANPGLAQRITEYPFSDPRVERLYEMLVREPLREFKKNNTFTPSTYYTFQYQVHDKVMQFYAADDVHAAVMEFIEN